MPYPATTVKEGKGRVKPSESFRAVVATTSPIIARTSSSHGCIGSCAVSGLRLGTGLSFGLFFRLCLAGEFCAQPGLTADDEIQNNLHPDGGAGHRRPGFIGHPANDD